MTHLKLTQTILLLVCLLLHNRDTAGCYGPNYVDSCAGFYSLAIIPPAGFLGQRWTCWTPDAYCTNSIDSRNADALVKLPSSVNGLCPPPA